MSHSRFESVLGLWTEVNKNEIWMSRQQHGLVASILGYGISILSVGLLVKLEIESGRNGTKVGKK